MGAPMGNKNAAGKRGGKSYSFYHKGKRLSGYRKFKTKREAKSIKQVIHSVGMLNTRGWKIK